MVLLQTVLDRVSSIESLKYDRGILEEAVEYSKVLREENKICIEEQEVYALKNKLN